MAFDTLILACTTIFVGLMAGLFFSYSFSVVPALKNLPDSEYIMGMQSVNKAIQNPVFFLVFFGCLLLLPISCYLNYSSPPSEIFWLVLAASIIYFGGVFAVTAVGNIPLNNALASFNLTGATKDAIIHQRAAFENRWNNLNTIRTVCSILSLVLLVITCINWGRK